MGKVFRYIHEGQRAQVVVNKWNIRRQSRYPFIDVLKRLEAGQVYGDKKCLFEWIGICQQYLVSSYFFGGTEKCGWR